MGCGIMFPRDYQRDWDADDEYPADPEAMSDDQQPQQQQLQQIDEGFAVRYDAGDMDPGIGGGMGGGGFSSSDSEDEEWWARPNMENGTKVQVCWEHGGL